VRITGYPEAAGTQKRVGRSGLRKGEVMSAERGSERMLKARMDRRTLPERDLQQLVELSRQDGVELRDIWIYGQPAPDVVSGTFQVNPEIAANVVQELLVREIRFRLDVFPLGIPIPDVVQIDFTSKGLNRT
jgi:hypothetical protein